MLKKYQVKNSHKKAAFTLAEVLITIAVVGVVAAMTIPNLITAYQKKQVETKLLKFYTTVNQAMQQSIEDNGNPDSWFSYYGTSHIYSYKETLASFEKNIAPYMKFLGYKQCSKRPNDVCATLPFGGVMVYNMQCNGGDILYVTEEKYALPYTDMSDMQRQRHYFVFEYAKLCGNATHGKNEVSVVPNDYVWNGKRSALLNDSIRGCSPNAGYNRYVYCTKLIQVNSWKIPADYPW